MKLSNWFVICFLSMLALPGCSSNEPEDEDTYELFPAGYFFQGFREEYEIAGTSPGGLVLEGTHLELTQDIQSVSEIEVRPVRVSNDWTDTQTSAIFSNAALSFYSTEGSELVGTEDLITGVTTTASTTEAIPSSAIIGDAGTVGVYVDPQGNTFTMSWRLEAADGDLARIVWATEGRDASGTLFIEGETSYVIDHDGNRQTIGIVFDLKQLNDPVTWTGTKM